MWDSGPFKPDEVWGIRNCLSNESLKSLVFMLDVERLEASSDLTIHCLSASSLRHVFPDILREKDTDAEQMEAILAILMSAVLMAIECSTAGELAGMGVTSDVEARMRCILEETDGGAELASAMAGGSAISGLGLFDQASLSCAHHVLDKESWRTPPEVVPEIVEIGK